MKISETKEIVRFIFNHYPVSWGWNLRDLIGWIWWLTAKGFMLTIRVSNKVVGLVVARPIDLKDVLDAGQFDDRHNESSPFVYADFILGNHPDVLRYVGTGLMQRFGHKSMIFYRRNGGPLKSRDFNALMERLINV